MFIIPGLWELGEGQKGKENDRNWIILKYITSLYEYSIIKCIGICWIVGAGGNDKGEQWEG
jgi:hypothetical protein